MKELINPTLTDFRHALRELGFKNIEYQGREWRFRLKFRTVFDTIQQCPHGLIRLPDMTHSVAWQQKDGSLHMTISTIKKG